MEKTWHTYYNSPLGNIRIGCNEQAVTELHFLHKDEPGFYTDCLADGPLVLRQTFDQLKAYFLGEQKDFSVPVQQTGTPFQQRVWNELMNIPYGKTISYLTLAKRLGDPKAIRAAATTNGKNNIAIIVPCHRVIGSNNGMIGYASGVWRKRWLLEWKRKSVMECRRCFRS